MRPAAWRVDRVAGGGVLVPSCAAADTGGDALDAAVAEVEKIEVAGNASLENEATIDETLNLAEPSADIAPVPVPLTVGLNKQQTAAAKRSWRVELGQISAPPTALEGGEAPAEEGSPPPAGVSTAFFRERTTERGAVPAAVLDGASAADYNMQMKLLRSARRGPASAACGAAGGVASSIARRPGPLENT